jgi:hypothetical protein
VKKRSSNPCWLRERSGEKRRGKVSADNFKFAVHRVLDIEVIDLSI